MKCKTKIIVYPDKLSRYGGANEFLNKLLPLLTGKGVETTIIIEKKDLKLLPSIIENNPNISTFPIWSRPNIFRKIFFNLIYDYAIIQYLKLKVRPDLIIFSNIGAIINHVAFRTNIPSIKVLHTVPSTTNKKIHWYYKICGNPGKNQFLCTVSEYSKNIIRKEIGVESEKIKVIPNIPKQANGTTSTNTNLLKKRGLTILTVGHVVDYKNPQVWFQVAKNLVNTYNVEFHWLGDGEYLPELEKKIKSEKLGNRIKLLGFSAKTEEYYQQSDIYFQPSIKESQGIAILEAMSFGLPVVASNSEGIIESVNHNVNGYTNSPNDYAKFIYHIEKLILNRKLRENFGYNSLRIISEQFSQSSYNNNWSNLIDQTTKK